jgi:hypothetical protein
MIVAGLLLTVALVGCQKNSMGDSVKGHQVTVTRRLLPVSDSKSIPGKYFRYAESSPAENFEFVIDGDSISVNGHQLGTLKVRDQVRVTDDGVSVWNAEKGKWLDYGETKAYLSENGRSETAQTN